MENRQPSLPTSAPPPLNDRTGPLTELFATRRAPHDASEATRRTHADTSDRLRTPHPPRWTIRRTQAVTCDRLGTPHPGTGSGPPPVPLPAHNHRGQAHLDASAASLRSAQRPGRLRQRPRPLPRHRLRARCASTMHPSPGGSGRTPAFDGSGHHLPDAPRAGPAAEPGGGSAAVAAHPARRRRLATGPGRSPNSSRRGVLQRTRRTNADTSDRLRTPHPPRWTIRRTQAVTCHRLVRHVIVAVVVVGSGSADGRGWAGSDGGRTSGRSAAGPKRSAPFDGGCAARAPPAPPKRLRRFLSWLFRTTLSGGCACLRSESLRSDSSDNSFPALVSEVERWAIRGASAEATACAGRGWSSGCRPGGDAAGSVRGCGVPKRSPVSCARHVAERHHTCHGRPFAAHP